MKKFEKNWKDSGVQFEEQLAEQVAGREVPLDVLHIAAGQPDFSVQPGRDVGGHLYLPVRDNTGGRTEMRLITWWCSENF